MLFQYTDMIAAGIPIGFSCLRGDIADEYLQSPAGANRCNQVRYQQVWEQARVKTAGANDNKIRRKNLSNCVGKGRWVAWLQPDMPDFTGSFWNLAFAFD